MFSWVSLKRKEQWISWHKKAAHSFLPYVSVPPCPNLPLLSLIKAPVSGLILVRPHFNPIKSAKTLLQNKVTFTGAGVRTRLCLFLGHNTTHYKQKEYINLGCQLYTLCWLSSSSSSSRVWVKQCQTPSNLVLW